MTCVTSKNVIELRAVEDDQMFCGQKEMNDEVSNKHSPILSQLPVLFVQLSTAQGV